MGLLDTLVGTESGGNYRAQNNEVGAGGVRGHYGQLQFGEARLQDAMRSGVIPRGTTPQQFLADSAMQDRVAVWHFNDIDRNTNRMGLNRFIGQTVGGVNITRDSIRAMAHIGGMGGARRFLLSGGRDDPSDSFGTSVGDYARIHRGDGSDDTVENAFGRQQPRGNAFSRPLRRTPPPNAFGRPEQQEQQQLQPFQMQTNNLSAADFMQNRPQHQFNRFT